MARGRLKKFKKVTLYPHKRSEGLTHRRNKGSALQGTPYWSWTYGEERFEGRRHA